MLAKIEKMIVPTVVIEEFVFALKSLHLKDEIIGTKIKEILGSENIKIESITYGDIKSATNILSAESLSFKNFNDKLILSVAKRKNLPILTFDKNLQKECKKQKIA
jgi:predicted nucleic acid-binding protein